MALWESTGTGLDAQTRRPHITFHGMCNRTPNEERFIHHGGPRGIKRSSFYDIPMTFQENAGCILLEKPLGFTVILFVVNQGSLALVMR